MPRSRDSASDIIRFITAFTVSAPYCSMTASMRSRPTVLAPTFARRSSPIIIGTRERRTHMSAMSSCSSPSRTTFTGGVGSDSENTSCAAGENEPSPTPPRSGWCAIAEVQPKSFPSQNTGWNTIASFWCSPPPTHGSLVRNMSPSAMPGFVARWRSVQ